MKDKQTGLTAYQFNFANLIAAGLKDIDAYKQAGYSQKQSNNSMRVSAYKLIQNPKILAVIEKNKAELTKKVELTNTLTVQNVLDNIDYGVKVCRERNNMTALARFVEMQGRYLSMFNENINVTDTIKQRVLDHIEAQEAERLADLRVKELVATPQITDNVL